MLWMPLEMALLLLSPLLLQAAMSTAMRPVNLRCERLAVREAIGIDSPTPLLSWAWEHHHLMVHHQDDDERRRGAPAPAATITFYSVVGSDVLATQHTKPGATSLHYAGPPLRSHQRVHWRVCSSGSGAAQCAAGSFLTGVLRAGDWEGAKWIAGRQLRSPELVVAGSHVKQATVSVTGLGFYELRLNGAKVGDAELDPGFSTNYTERVLYATYDVTAQVAASKGKVVLAARVGAGKYSMAVSHSNTIIPGRSVFALMAVLRVTRSDGSNLTLPTDSSWMTSPTPLVAEHLYHGETYDARLELAGWDTVGHAPLTNWSAAKVIEPPLGKSAALSPRLFPPIRVVEVVMPVNVTQLDCKQPSGPPPRPTPPCIDGWWQSGAVCEQMCVNNAQGRDSSGRCLCGQASPNVSCSSGLNCEHGVCSPGWNANVSTSWMFDLGNNFAGVPRVTLPTGVRAGHVMTLAVTEYPAEAVVPGRGTTYGQQDTYIFSGKETPGQQYRPTFIYHGFRYIRLDNFPGTKAEGMAAAVGLFMHSDVDRHGSLNVSTETQAGTILQDIHKMVVQTQRCNVYSVPTDCPQREKRGWMGDAQWTAEEAMLNLDMGALYANWIRTMNDLQTTGCTRVVTAKTLPMSDGANTNSYCCLPTPPGADKKHPKISYCSPQYNQSDVTGSIPDVVPNNWGGGGSRGWPGAPTWSVAYVIIPGTVLALGGDMALVETHYKGIRAHIDFLARQASYGGGVPQFGLLGDWCAVEAFCPGSSDGCLSNPGWTNGDATTAFYFIYALKLLVNMANATGRSADVTAYSAMLGTAKTAYHTQFFSNGSYGASQTGNALPIAGGIVPSELLPGALRTLESNIAARDNHVSVGGVGARWLLQALTAANRTDLALDLATQATAPSWYDFVLAGPGTLHEQWGTPGRTTSICTSDCAMVNISGAGYWSGVSDQPSVASKAAASAKQCYAACLATPWCVQVTWAPTHDKCSLYRSIKSGPQLHNPACLGSAVKCSNGATDPAKCASFGGGAGGEGGSMNHPMFGGGVDPWIYHHIGGLRPTMDVFTPHIASFGVERVVFERVRGAAAETVVRGHRVRSSWRWDSARHMLDYNVTVPPGFVATLTVPTEGLLIVYENNTAVWRVGGATDELDRVYGITLLREPGVKQELRLLSGVFCFTAVFRPSAGFLLHQPVKSDDVEPLAAKNRASQAPAFDVTAYGADSSGHVDSTKSIQQTFAAAAESARKAESEGAAISRGAPLVLFPAGSYTLTDVVNISRYFDPGAPSWPGDAVALRIEAQGTAALVQAGGATRDLLFCDQAWRVVINGLRLVGGRDQLAIGNNNSGAGSVIRVNDCEFEHSNGAAVRNLGPSCNEAACPFPPFVGSFSTQLIVRDCVFDFCDQALVTWSDWGVLSDSYIITSPNMTDKAVIENHAPFICEEVSSALESQLCGHVNRSSSAALTAAMRGAAGSSIIIEHSEFGGGCGKGSDASACCAKMFGAEIVLEELPAQLIIRDNFAQSLIDPVSLVHVDAEINLHGSYVRAADSFLNSRPTYVIALSNARPTLTEDKTEQLRAFLSHDSARAIEVAAPPAAGSWRRGSVLMRASTGENLGWACVESGWPDKWVASNELLLKTNDIVLKSLRPRRSEVVLKTDDAHIVSDGFAAHRSSSRYVFFSDARFTVLADRTIRMEYRQGASALGASHGCGMIAPRSGVNADGPGVNPRSGPDHVRLPNASACAAACCARNANNDSECGGFTFDPIQPNDSGSPACQVGKPCCWLKAPGATARTGVAKRFVSGIVQQHGPPPPPPPPLPPPGPPTPPRESPWDDELSTTFIVREPPVPAFTTAVADGALQINTSALQLTYTGGMFSASSIKVIVAGATAVWWPGAEEGNLNGSLTSTDCNWCENNTYCSKHANSPSGCIKQYRGNMQPGILSRVGFHLVDDTGNFLFDGSVSWPPHGWRRKRDFSGNYSDWTLFGYGQGQYRLALADYSSLAGPIPLMPYRAYGVWWSNYFPFNVSGITDVIEGYAAHEMPLHYVVLDVDWHKGSVNPSTVAGCNIQTTGTLNTPLCNRGYGGYSWNRQLFPDPEGFQAWLHARNLSLMLNLHDLCSEDHCQRAYPQVAKAVGIDPSTKQTVACAFENQALQEALHTHELESGENANVDAWWTDSGMTRVGYWCNENHGPQCDIVGGGKPTGDDVAWRCITDTAQTNWPTEGATNLRVRNVFTPATLWQSYVRHSRALQKGKRGFRLGVYGGLGSHRYPLVGSGDTHSAWQTLAWEVHMSITGANVLTAWRHDVGGFYQSDNNKMNTNKLRDPELLLRWLQFAVFSPIVTPHCNHCELRAWFYPNFRELRAYFQLRNALMVYLYSAAFQASRSAVLPLHGLYIDYPDEEDAYTFTDWESTVSTVKPCPHVPQFAPCAVTRTQEYSFGDAFVVAPIFEPADKADGLVRKLVWIPPGRWVRWQAPSAEPLEGPRRMTAEFNSAEMAVFAREGAVIPLKGYEAMHDISATMLTLQVVLSPTGSCTRGNTSIYEDDGGSMRYIEDEQYSVMRVLQVSNATSTVLEIVPMSSGGGYHPADSAPIARRSYELQLLCGAEDFTLLSATVDGVSVATTTRRFGPNNVSTAVVTTPLLNASMPVLIVTRHAFKTGGGILAALKTEDDSLVTPAGSTVGHLNTKDYGAVGDGKAEDTAALQRAIDAAQTRGEALHFPVATTRSAHRSECTARTPLCATLTDNYNIPQHPCDADCD